MKAMKSSAANRVGTLRNAIWQFPFRNLEEVLRKANRYSSLGVPKLAHKRVTMVSALGHALWSFLKHYIFKLGFIDGWAGFVIAFGNFEGTYYRYAKRYEAIQNWSPPPSQPLRREAEIAAESRLHDNSRRLYGGTAAGFLLKRIYSHLAVVVFVRGS